MNAITRIAAATLLGAGLLASAAAVAEPRVVGTGDNASVEYSVPSHNIVGGATYRTTGSGEGATTEVVSVLNAQTGRLARVVGTGENASVVYVDPAPASQRLAQAGLGR